MTLWNAVLDALRPYLTRPMLDRFFRHWFPIIIAAVTGHTLGDADAAVYSAAGAAFVTTLLSIRNEKTVRADERKATIRRLETGGEP